METCVKVRSDGYHMIASFPICGFSVSGGKREASEKSKLFDVYFSEAQQKGIPKRKICSYIKERICEERWILDWLSEEEILKFYKNKIRNLHRRISRYKNKLFLTDWNYYVTFTYDDQKETAESFEKRLKKCFSNFKVRNGWLVICVPEEGEENGRKHFHCLLQIPEGGMVGELVLRTKYSRKRRRTETWTDNTYFSERFGISVWKAINHDDLRGNFLQGYLVKYLSKSGNKLFYSRGIPSELEMVIDTEKDVYAMFNNYGVKAILIDSLFMVGSWKKRNRLLDFSIEETEIPGYTLDNLMKIP